MSLFKDPYERIKFATNTRTQVELAEVLDIRQSSISDAKRRNSVPADWYMKLFEKFGLNPDWLKHGSGPLYLRTEQGYQAVDAPLSGVAEEPAYYGEPLAKAAFSTVYGMVCPFKDGHAVPPLPALGKIVLPQSFAGNGVTVLRMDASNMEPSMRRGSYVGVDTASTNPVSGDAFAIYEPNEGITIKRVFLDNDNNCYILRSDAPEFPSRNIAIDSLHGRVMGRIVWVLQNF